MVTISGMLREKQNRLFRDLIFIFLSLLIVSVAVFSLSSFSSGSISYYVLGESADESSVKELSSSLGLERPFFIRYLEFLKSFFTFNWGKNIQGYEIRSLIAKRFSVTVEVLLLTLILSLPLSILASCSAMKKQRGLLDRGSDLLVLFIMSLPSFSIAILLMLIFSVSIPFFPTSGFVPLSLSLAGNLRTVFLPSLSLALMHGALYVRVLKKSLRRELCSEYVQGARARGKGWQDIIYREAFPPASLSLLSLASQSVSSLIAGSAVTETVFALPGLGSLIVSASLARDTQTVSILIMLIALTVSITSIAARILISCMSGRGGVDG